MFERFTDRARNVVVLAQEEARLLKHNYIGTEHLLLGLIRESDGIAARALESLGIGLDAVRQQVEEIIGQGKQAPSGRIPFTPRAKKVLELSLREALQLQHNYIGTEHILLGLLREGEGVAAQVLVRLDGDLSKVRQRVIQLQKENPTTEEIPAAAQARAEAASLTEGAGQAEGPAPLEGGRQTGRGRQTGPGRLAGRGFLSESGSLTGQLDEVLRRLDLISGRLTVIEKSLGIGTAKDDD